MKIRLVHVARDGKVLGQYPPDQVASLYETGHFAATDVCFSDLFPDWITVPEFLEKHGTPKFSKGKPRSVDQAKAKSPRSSRRSSRRQATATALGGWIAFLLAFAALVGSGFWILSLFGELRENAVTMDKMRAELAAKEKENQRLLFVAREIADPGTARGSVILRNSSGKKIAIPGLRVFLFQRSVVEKHLDKRFAEAATLAPDTPIAATAFLLEQIPTPTADTVTDASGRFEFKIAEPGEYVLIASLPGDASTPERLWLVGFDSRDSMNVPVEINEMNSVQQLVRSLIITQGR